MTDHLFVVRDPLPDVCFVLWLLWVCMSDGPCAVIQARKTFGRRMS